MVYGLRRTTGGGAVQNRKSKMEGNQDFEGVRAVKNENGIIGKHPEL